MSTGGRASLRRVRRFLWGGGFGSHRRRLLALALGLALVVASFAVSGAAGLPGPGTARAATASGHPNRFDPRSQATSVRPAHLPGTTTAKPMKVGPPQPARQGAPVPMKPGVVALDPGKGGHLQGSDGVLEISVPAGAVTKSDLSAAGGKLGLVVRQILPPSGSNAGGSGHYSFGTYLIQLVDAHGHLLKHGLRKPLQLKLHYGQRGSALDLRHAYVVVNGTLPRWVNLDPSAIAISSGAFTAASVAPEVAVSAPAARLGAAGTQPTQLDGSSQTLSTSLTTTGSSTAVSFDTDAPVATFGNPDPFQADLSGGGLTAKYPIAVPAGPGGLTPPVQLSYASASVSEQHNPQGAAGWVGEGWNLSLGAISWAEHNVESGCNGCTPWWEDSWQLVDPFGTSADLIPPNINVITYYDDTPTWPITPTPVAWHTAPETHDKIYSYTGPNSLPGMSAVPPCFRVFHPNGIMEEFGCTPDSLQFYPEPSGPNAGYDYIANWLLDLVTDPEGNQIHVTYQADTESGYNGISYPRDVVPATVEWDSPSCHNAQVACTGSSWQPLMRVRFVASHAVARVDGSGCPANGNLRCDDPVDLSGSGGLPAPTVQHTFVLNDIQVQVRSSPSLAWNTLRDYQLSYDQGGPSTITDPVSGKQESVAGRLLLTDLVELGDDGVTAMPRSHFGYSQVTQYYTDSLQLPTPSTNCGPAWNTGIGSNGSGPGCLLWSQSYAGNSYYLSSVSNGLGLTETYGWQNARANMHGVNSGQAADIQNPFYCNSPGVESSWPCDMADDSEWSRAVLTQQQDTVIRLSQAGQGGSQTSVPVTSTTSYTYQVTYPYPAQECATCVAGFYWGNQNDNDYLDYYNYRFMGFAQVTVVNPDGSVDVHKFYSTEGMGVYDTSQVSVCSTYPPNPCHNDPWWDLTNAAHGHEYELDHYASDGTTLLARTVTQWQAVCPPTGVAGSPPDTQYGAGNWDGNLAAELDHSNPIAVCDVRPTQVDDYTNDGSGQALDKTVSYTYDAYGRVASTTTTTNDGGATGSPTTIVSKPAYTWNDSVTATSTSATGTYLTDFQAFTDLEDPSGNRYACTYTSYDGQPNTVGQTGGLTRGEETRVDRYTDCGSAANGFVPSGQISVSKVYDASGNAVAGDDADALAGNTAHVGCTVGGTQYSDCTGYDPTFQVLPTSTANALNQSQSTGYSIFTTPPPSGPIAAGVAGKCVDDSNDSTTPGAHVQIWDCNGTAAQSWTPEPDGTLRVNGLCMDVTNGGTGNGTPVQLWTCNGSGAQVWQASDGALLNPASGRCLDDPGASSTNGTQLQIYDCNGTSAQRWGVPQAVLADSSGDDNQAVLNGGVVPGLPGAVAGDTAVGFDGRTGYAVAPASWWLDVAGPMTIEAWIKESSATGPIPSGVSGKCVDDSGGSTVNGTHVQVWDCNGTAAQSWTTEADGTLRLDGKCMDVSGGSTDNGALVQLWDCTGGANQVWRPGPNGSLVNPVSGRCLDDPNGSTTNGTQLQIWDCTGGTNQRWTLPGAGPIVEYNSGSAFGVHFWAWPSPDTLWVNFVDTSGNGHGLQSPTGEFVVGKWYHVVATYDGTYGRLYINGTQVAQANLGSFTPQTSLPLYIGRRPSGNPNSYFSGAIDEVAIYQDALPSNEIQAHYSAASGTDYSSVVLDDLPNAYYRLDDEGLGASGGFGLWPTSTTDANGQTTTTTYDALGRPTSETLPGETAGETTSTTTYTVWCSGTDAQTPAPRSTPPSA